MINFFNYDKINNGLFDWKNSCIDDNKSNNDKKTRKVTNFTLKKFVNYILNV